MNLSIAQLVQLAQIAGWSGEDLATAVAIALAESGGNPNAYNPETGAGAAQGKGSYGLWQIYLSAHPEDASGNLYDPPTNANDAYRIYSAAGNSFSPWSTFKSGAYLAQMPAVGLVVAGGALIPDLASGGGVDPNTTDTTTTADVTNILDGAGGPGQQQILLLVAGGALIFWALSRYL